MKRKIGIIIMLVMLLFTTNSSILQNLMVVAAITEPEVLDSNRYLFTLPTVASEEWRTITVTEPCSSIDITVSGTFDSPVSFGVYASQDRASIPLADRGITLQASNAITEETNIPVAIEEPGTYWLYFTNSCNLNPYYYDEGVNTSGIICEYKVLKGDSYENNNTMENATPLLANTPHEFTLLGMGDRDWFKCTVYDLADPLSVTIGCNEGNFDSRLSYTVYYLNEYTGNLNRIGGVGDVNQASGAIISTTTKTYTLEDVGDYYIHVTNASNLNSQYYWGDNDIPLTITTNFGYDESKIAVELAENEFLLKVYDKTGIIPNLPVTINSELYKTDERGMIIFEDEINKEEDVQSISVAIESQDGKYSRYYMNPFYINKDTKVGFVKLKAAGESDYELMSALIGKYDVLNGTKKACFRNDVKTIITVQPYSEVGIDKYVIMQGNEVIAESKLRAIEVAGGNFKIGEDVYVVLYDIDGNELSKTLLNMKVIAIDTSLISKLSISDKLSITISPNIPYLDEAKFDFKLNDGDLPTFSITDDTIKVGVNIDLAELSDKSVSEQIKKIKELQYPSTIKDSYSLTTQTGLYAELKFCDGLLVSSGGSAFVKLGLKGEVSRDFIVSTPIGFVPLTTTIGLDGEFKFEPSVHTNVYTGNVEYDQNIEAELKANASIGVGITDASLSAYGEGTIKAKSKKLSTIDAVTANLDFGIYLKINSFLYKYHLYEKKDFVIYERGSTQALNLQNQSLMAMSEDLYNLENYSVLERDYLANRSKFYTNSASSTYNNTLQSSTYPYIEPQMVNNNGIIMMAYLDDNGGEDNANFQQLVYSIYNSKWQQPVAIDEDTNIENSFYLYTDNSDIYMVYTELNNTVSETITAEEMAKMQEIVIAKYDKAQSKFADMATLTNNETYDFNPRMTVINGVPVVVWLNNTDNNMLGTTNNNSIYYSKYENNTWTEPQALLSGSTAITKMEMGILNNEVSIAYINDTDNNLSTFEDRILNVINLDKENKQLVSDIGTSSYVEYTKYNNNDMLVWKKDDKIQGISNINTDIQDIYTSNSLLSASDIKLIKNYDGNDMITFVKPLENEQKTKLFGVKNIDGQWKNERVIYSQNANDYVDAYGITTYNTNYLIAVVLDSNVDMETLDKTSNLQTMRIYNSADPQIYVQDITIDGNTVSMNLILDNIADCKQTTQKIEILDSEDNVIYTEDIVAVAQIGEAKEIPITFTLDNPISSENYTIKCRMRPSTMTSDVIKEAEFNLRQVDFEVYSEQIVMNGKNYVSLTVENNGYYNSKSALNIYKVNATEESMVDEKVKTIVTNPLGHGESAHYFLEVTDELLPDGKTEGVIKVVANTVEGVEELAITDNTTSVAVANFSEEEPYIKGDLNNDGLVNSADAAKALVLYKYNNATEEELKRGDMNDDGLMNSADAAKILTVYKY
ncbi:MAG: dockerin type I repeat-containing protein, partial [Clostridia bacterium]|nr:dockerin type I repeat-containing protein [Clostridia bacterium]